MGLKLNGIHLLLVCAYDVYLLGSNINTIKNKDVCEELTTFHYILSTCYDTGHIENTAFNSSVVVCIFVASGTYLPSRCIATAVSAGFTIVRGCTHSKVIS
jgi:hypothetical protein